MTAHQLCRQESNIEIDFLGQDTIAKKDLVPSTRNIAALARLYKSLVSLFRFLGMRRVLTICRHGLLWRSTL